LAETAKVIAEEKIAKGAAAKSEKARFQITVGLKILLKPGSDSL
jgi:hypothetical protein